MGITFGIIEISMKLDSWKDLLVYLGIGLIITLLMTAFYVLGSRIPRKEK